MRDWTFGRVLASERSGFTAFYVTAVRILHAFRFYDVRNERYASFVRSLAGPTLREGQVMVDLGCGPGGVTALMRGDHKLFGVDSDRGLLDNFIEPSIPRVQARAERLPFRTRSVDVIVALSLVEHIANQSAFFVEIARVLRGGGCLVLQLPELRYPIEPHRKWPLLYVWNPVLQNRILAATGYQDLNISTSLGGITGFANEAGLRVDRVIRLWHFRLARIGGLPMGYFIAFKKEET